MRWPRVRNLSRGTRYLANPEMMFANMFALDGQVFCQDWVRKETNKQTNTRRPQFTVVCTFHARRPCVCACIYSLSLSLSLIFLTHFFPFETIEYLRVFNFLTNKLVSLSYHSKLLNYPGQILVYSFFLYMSMNEFMNECNWWMLY